MIVNIQMKILVFVSQQCDHNHRVVDIHIFLSINIQLIQYPRFLNPLFYGFMCISQNLNQFINSLTREEQRTNQINNKIPLA